MRAPFPDSDFPEIIQLINSNKTVSEKRNKLKDYNLNDTLRESGITPLHYFVMSENEQAVALLLSAGANVNARDDGDLTPLQLSEKIGNTKITNLLLKTTYLED